MIISGIYLIQHRESGKGYVGRSTDIANRWGLHKRHTEDKRDRCPFHRALLKYGYDAFDWVVLIEAPSPEHEALEWEYIQKLNSMVPFGYNVGGVKGGRPTKEILALMGEAERNQVIAEMRAHAKNMYQAICALRINPEYEAAYLAGKKASAIKREANRRIRFTHDPEYVEKERLRRRNGGLKSHETMRQREAANPVLAAQRRERRSLWAKTCRANDPRTLAANARKAAQS